MRFFGKVFSIILCLIILPAALGCGINAESQIKVNRNIKTEVTPDDFKVFSLELGGLTDEELYNALKDGVENYFISVTIDGVSFPVSGSELGMRFNSELDLSDAADRISKGLLTAEQIEKELVILDDEKLSEEVFIDEYASYLQFLIENAKEDKEAAEAEKKEQQESASAQKADGSQESAADNSMETLSEEELESLEDRLEKVYGQTRAHIEYSTKSRKFVGVDGKAGEAFDFSAAASTFFDSVKKLAPTMECVLPVIESDGEKFEDSELLKAALEKANNYLSIEIIYNFNPPGGNAGQEKINEKNIMNYIYIALNGRDIDIDTDELTVYATSLAAKYSFVDVKEEEIDKDTVNIIRTGWEVGYKKIYDNVLSSLENAKSGTYEAEYQQVNETKKADKDDLYVLVDLTAQMVYLYEGGIVIYSTPCVSGKVSAGNMTHTGTFKIYSKETNRTLKGRNYSSFVKYWMPFDENIGLHDASWRSEFGGDIYVYGGSHGCVNLSRSAAKYIYSKVKVGTKVVVTGGLSSVKGYSGGGSDPVSVNDSTKATTKSNEISVPESSALPSSQTFESSQVPAESPSAPDDPSAQESPGEQSQESSSEDSSSPENEDESE